MLLIHKGKAELQTPGKFEVIYDDNPASKTYGETITNELEPGETKSVKLPPGGRFGEYSIGVPVEVTDRATQEALKRRGFEEISADEASTLRRSGGKVTTDWQALEERERDRAHRAEAIVRPDATTSERKAERAEEKDAEAVAKAKAEARAEAKAAKLKAEASDAGTREGE